MTLTVTVTARHIAQGAPSECSHCPIALAIADALEAREGQRPSFVGVSLYMAKAQMPGSSAPRLWILPISARAFVVRFDAGKPVEPFIFTLEGEG